MAAERGKGVKPFGHTAIAKYLDEKIEDIKAFKTQRQIAEEVGFKNSEHDFDAEERRFQSSARQNSTASSGAGCGRRSLIAIRS